MSDLDGTINAPEQGTDENQSRGQGAQRQKQGRGGVPISLLNALMVILAIVVSVVFLRSVQHTNDAYTELETTTSSYITCEAAANRMKEASSNLTIWVRTFAVTRDVAYMHRYFQEVKGDNNREAAVATIKEYHGGSEPYEYIQKSFENSQILAKRECYAIKLIVEADGIEPTADEAAELKGVELTAQDAALSAVDKRAKAEAMLFDEQYMERVELIMSNIDECKACLIDDINRVQKQGSTTLHELLFRQQVLTVLLLVVTVLLIVFNVVLLLWPLRRFVVRISNNESLPRTGARELRFLTDAYNVMYQENLKSHDVLRRKAEHDHLTGLYNRGAFEKLLDAYRSDNYALLLIDADYFKSINDTLGHDGGDAMLRKIAHTLSDAFRATDFSCRIGGDEFAVVMTEADPSLKSVIIRKIEQLRKTMADASDGLPEMTLSIGVAFNDGTLSPEEILKHADIALYEVKEAGRNGYRFFKG